MRPDVLAHFRCPSCKRGALQERSGDGAAGEPIISCASCHADYPIVDSIPRFVPRDNYATSFGLQWNRHRRSQLDSHSRVPISRERLFDTTAWGTKLDGELILEAGSGAGRFTEILLSTGARVFSFDYSEAVVANKMNQAGHPDLVLFQGDICRLPLVPCSFDKVLCLGVLQHTPDPERSFKCLVEQIRPGGEIAIDVYAKRATGLLSWKYLLRPITTRMPAQRLQATVDHAVDVLLPAAQRLRATLGRVGARLLPIVEYSHLGLSPEINRDWARLDTFDMYAPAHDHPQTEATVRRWFEEAGLVEVTVRPGANGIIARGRKPRAAS